MKTISELRALVADVTRKEGPALYRDLYGLSDADTDTRIETTEDWNALPFLTKEMLLATPLTDRTFVPLCDVDAFYHTSGTSGKPPLFTPRVLISKMDYRERLFSFSKGALSSIGYQHRVEAFFSSIGITVPVVQIDAQEIDLTCRLAIHAEIESIFTHTFLMPLLIDAFTKLKYTDAISYIELTGEVCPPSLYARIRATFPRAMVVLSYGLTEIEDPCVGTVCMPSIDATLHDVFHERGENEHHLEIIDPESGNALSLVAGTEGELVVTSDAQGQPAFPLIRYRTGDMVHVVETACKIHNTWTFRIIGRTAKDFIRTTGGTFRADEVSRAVKESGFSIEDFELHVYTETPVRAVLKVAAKEALDTAAASRAISQLMRVGPQSSYEDAVVRGYFLPLECELLPTSVTPRKRDRLVKHA